ncbi:hypothetical protein GSI_12394 [Ganoderma sinense ZZ0214-1]|uniref:Terpene synthase n=1 Tax=Ganoderma sinense ZZ0214-1 TaxID=1077348 RepID=A0A2G8RVK4_9APHY|nr:hypothetical protein GSI_12394 [Ganoderma sinense ZZ0214-1]
MAAFNRLLSLLNLATLENDAINNPTPWSWGPWMARFQADRAPWAGPRWVPKTGFSRKQWTLVRSFVVAFYESGDNRLARNTFASGLSEGDQFEGLQILMSKIDHDWEQARIDCDADTILASMGINQLVDLHMETFVNRTSIPNIAELFFGRDAFVRPNVLLAVVSGWVLDVLSMTIDRWTLSYNERVQGIPDFQAAIYNACRDVSMPGSGIQEIADYFNTAASLIAQLNLTIDNERQRQLDYYRDVMFATLALIDGSDLAGRGLPPNMRSTLLKSGSWSEEECTVFREGFVAFLDGISLASRHVPESYREGVDVYRMLCEMTLGMVVDDDAPYLHLEENPENHTDNSAVWQDPAQAAFLFAACTLPHVYSNNGLAE